MRRLGNRRTIQLDSVVRRYARAELGNDATIDTNATLGD